MSVLSKSVKTAQRGRSFTGVPEYGAARRHEGTAMCQCGWAALPAAALPSSTIGSQRLQIVGAMSPVPRLAPAPEGVTVLYPTAGEPQRLGRAGQRRALILDREAGMATAEYAIATLAAVAFAALLVAVLGSGEVRSLLMGLIRNALTLG